jgi:hypothetical protein
VLHIVLHIKKSKCGNFLGQFASMRSRSEKRSRRPLGETPSPSQRRAG